MEWPEYALTRLLVGVQFEKDGSYQGFALAMPPTRGEAKRLQPLLSPQPLKRVRDAGPLLHA